MLADGLPPSTEHSPLACSPTLCTTGHCSLARLLTYAPARHVHRLHQLDDAYGGLHIHAASNIVFSNVRIYVICAAMPAVFDAAANMYQPAECAPLWASASLDFARSMDVLPRHDKTHNTQSKKSCLPRELIVECAAVFGSTARVSAPGKSVRDCGVPLFFGVSNVHSYTLRLLGTLGPVVEWGGHAKPVELAHSRHPAAGSAPPRPHVARPQRPSGLPGRP